MNKRQLVLLLCLVAIGSVLANARDNGRNDQENYRHVLLISVDGLHALDVANYVQSHPQSTMAQLANRGITYTNARTPRNSDSFPGLLALITGGSPVSHGFFYDVSYDRKIFDPNNVTCTLPAGNMMVFDESIDLYDAQGNDLNAIDPTKLPNYIDRWGHCSRLYPHAALRTNTIFEVVKADGGRTAWADKHPAYDLVNGPSGKGVDDLFTPEITTNSLDATHSVVCTVLNDQLKVTAILNEINGLTHDGKTWVGVPEVFGMNFQGVSVGQKLSSDNSDGSCTADMQFTGQAGGYTDGLGTPTAVLQYALDQTDAALGSMVSALKAHNLYNSTLIVLTAKHGQSPINPARVNKPGHFADLVSGLPDGQSNPNAIAITSAANCATGSCGFVNDDDIALIWLADQTLDSSAADYINTNAVPLFAEEVMAGNELTLQFNDPTKDSRTPDIIVQPMYGTIYTKSSAKNAEHGGFAFSDTNVGLILSAPGLKASVIKAPVTTAQVAPTILQALKLDPNSLNSVNAEQTPVLPETGLGNGR